MVIKLDKIVKVGYFLTLPFVKMAIFPNFIVWNSKKQVKSTPDNLNLLGKSKKFELLGVQGK